MFLLYLLYFSNFVFLFIDYKFSTFIWKFYHVINKSATVYPLAGNMFTACYPLYRVKILTISATPLQKLASVTAGLAALGLILEASLRVELLLTGGEHEFGAAFLAN